MPERPSFLSDRPTDPRAADDAADVLTSVVDTLRLRTRLFCRSELRAPWSLALRASDFAHFHVVVRGGAWLHLDRLQADRAEPLALTGGDLVIVPHGAGHLLTDGPQPDPRALVALPASSPPAAGPRAAPSGGTARHLSAAGDPPPGPIHPGSCQVLRGSGNGPETHLVCGSFQLERRHTHPLLELLPPVLHLRPTEGTTSEWLEVTLRLLAREAREARPGHQIVVSRLTDILFVQALRVWIDTLPAGQGGWLGALRDGPIGAALAHLHRDPARRWTNESLARAVGMSRSRFAARFAALVGEPPLAYLTRWRLARAAELLLADQLSVAAVAAAVGYESEAAFGKAFRRQYGEGPGSWRRRSLRAA
jgi:AraC-like DNA-binding protein